MSIVFIISLKRNSFSTNIVNTIQYTSFKINVFPLFVAFITLSYAVGCVMNCAHKKYDRAKHINALNKIPLLFFVINPYMIMRQ